MAKNKKKSQLNEKFDPSKDICYSSNWKVLEEKSEGKQKFFRIEGIFAQVGVKNKNERVYPVQLFDREVGKLEDRVSDGTLFMQNNHPASQSDEHVNNISGIINELSRPDSEGFVRGKATVPIYRGWKKSHSYYRGWWKHRNFLKGIRNTETHQRR